MIFCTYCGEKLNDGMKFCTKCGKPVKGIPGGDNPPAPAPVPQPKPAPVPRPQPKPAPVPRPQPKPAPVPGPVPVPPGPVKEGIWSRCPWLKYVLIGIGCAVFGVLAAWLFVKVKDIYFDRHEAAAEAESAEDNDFREEEVEDEYEPELPQAVAPDAHPAEEYEDDDEWSSITADAPPAFAEPAEEMMEEPVEEEEDSGYILPDSADRVLSESDLFGLSEKECRLARNEIYARHGRRFKDSSIQEYFDGCDWYEGRIDPGDFREDILSDTEKANRDLIVQYEKKHGFNQ